MTNMEKLLDALADCGEAAAFYKGKNIVMANRLFAEMFEIEQEACMELPILEIIHEESVEMISDYIRRRTHGDIDMPTSYVADFRTKSNSRLPLQLTVIRTRDTDKALLVILQKV
jgi:PAS domain-containing protein